MVWMDFKPYPGRLIGRMHSEPDGRPPARFSKFVSLPGLPCLFDQFLKGFARWGAEEGVDGGQVLPGFPGGLLVLHVIEEDHTLVEA